MLAPIPSPEMLSSDGTPLGFRDPRTWFVLLVVPGRERDSSDWLKRGRLAIYWPNFSRRLNSGTVAANGRARRRPTYASIIPGYLFMADRLGSKEPWSVVHDTPYVHGFLRNGTGHPASMEDADIEIIRKIEAGLNVPPPIKQVHRYKIGDKVRFVDDLVGRWPHGVVTRLADDGRISVDVKGLLGQVVPVWAEPHQIEAM